MATATLGRFEDLAGPTGFGDLYARVRRCRAHRMQLFDRQAPPGGVR
ncbi:hypothetical protein ACH40E_36370 [Streptomyces acidicola]